MSSQPPACPFSAETYNPMVPAHQANPHPTYAQARATTPVFYSPLLGMWVVMGYEDICAVLKDPASFSSLGNVNIAPTVAAEARAVLAAGDPDLPTLVNNDPPGHTRFRGLVNRAFTPRRIAALEPRIRELTQALVDRFAADGRADLMAQFASPLPLLVILELMGVPIDDAPQIKRWSDDWLLLISGLLGSVEEQVRCAQSVVAFQRYLGAAIDARREITRSDLVSDLLAAHLEGEQPLTRHELIVSLMQLVFAGHETTTNLIGSALALLLRERERYAALCERPELAAAMIEEALRLEGPVQAMLRTTTAPVTLGGQAIPQGALVKLVFASANREEAIFPAPDVFDIQRDSASRHLSFGRGIHFCIGAPLARLEGRVALEVLATRLPSLRLADDQELSYVPNLLMRGLQALRVTWDAQAGAGSDA